ncbi:MAG: hypothetical protein GWO24_16100 [Akkermansiaceae bacterium]|nr:hypothetical protein [Akkermansiaceae bacterium]
MRFLGKHLFAALLSLTTVGAEPALTGSILDGHTGEPVPARLYIRSAAGDWHHARSRGGVAVPYKVQRGPRSIEVHTTLSAHPFEVDLPPGTYTLTAERGKEHHPATRQVVIEGEKPVGVELKVKRWTETPLASRGWYSGDTHVHRKVEELPTLLLAEDLNVGLPLTSWVTDSREAPSKANKNPEPVPPARLIEVDDTHVIWPVNTEYEIFTVNGKRHTLGAVFMLNHRKPFELTAPPVAPIAEEARRQGAILDLDKHNWPWSMMLVPVMGVELFELTNNHLWRTEFFFNRWQAEYTPTHWSIERDEHGYTERGWIEFGFRNYYALLNCGFDMKPSAGTASGVHPVPLGFGRVYVKVEDGFTYDRWLEGLAAGNSFVTTGPILDVTVRGGKGRKPEQVFVGMTYEGRHPPESIEVIVNGQVVWGGRSGKRGANPTPRGGWKTPYLEHGFPLKTSSWIAVRAFEKRPDGRPRFAHSAPVYIDLPGKPLVPDRADVEYLVKRVEDELKRHEGVLPEAALAEYRRAAAAFRARLKQPATR